MMKEKYIIIVSDYSKTLSKIMNALECIKGYNKLTINSISLLDQMSSLKPELIIVSCKNNVIELTKLNNLKEKTLPKVLCLINRFENINYSQINTPLITLSLEQSLEKKYLLSNVNSLLQINCQVEKNNSPSKDYKGKSLSLINENKNLARYVLELDQKRELLKNIVEKVRELGGLVDSEIKVKLNSIINQIKLDGNSNHWEDFKVYFENINPGFIKSLSLKYPSLTSKDLKYCCYLKMNMSNEDIRNLLGINQESVRTHKYRLKKKMVLKKEQDLKSYINLF
ncbi:helix-turn-helix transcriptional regulator [Tenacibaculum xiamenense]|uniref:helix-turn-helix transcriptional regulator n=1 Tax=Tenacibaculum xiamenense TaxID=1261553 RepID=UPI0038967579